MSNFNVKVTGTANVKQMQAAFGALQSQVVALNTAMARMVSTSAAVDPAGYSRMASAMERNSSTFRNAALSTRQFEVHQLRLNSATDEYIKKLQSQKISFREWRKDADLAQRAYREQLAMENMVVRKGATTIGGKQTIDVVVPNEAHRDLDTLGNRIGWVREQTRSAATQMVNWGKNTQWAGRQLMVGFTMPVIAFGAAAGVMSYQVDKEMTRIQKVYDTTAQITTGSMEEMKAVNKELDAVREASMETAIKSAQRYGAAVTDTLKVQADLAATGLNGKKLQSSTDQVMRIATLGELDTTQATQMTIALQTAFKDTIKTSGDLTEALDFMNATENATSLSIQDIAEATPRAASAMSALGVNVKEMTVMLTSMKESGVDAAEAANALKSATGTILAPSPAADEFIKQISNGRVQVTELANASDGNLFVALQKLSEQMQGLSKLQKQQILVKLFGKYQFNRVSAMLYNMEDAFNGVQNQTSKAMELMGEDSATLADTAERELTRYQESISGKFKRTLETLKGELSQMGDPFLEVATGVMKVLVKIMSAFNSLPDGLKKFAAIGMIVGALIGPAIMLTGLFANLFGNILKVGVAMTGFLGKMNILDRDSRAAKIAAELAASGFQKEATAVEKLRQELILLAQAQRAANLETRRGTLLAQGYTPAQVARMTAVPKPPPGKSGVIHPSTAGATGSSAIVAESSKKAALNWKRASTNMVVAAGALSMMTMHSEGAVGHFSKIVFYAAMLGPLVWSAAGGLRLILPGLKIIGTVLKFNILASLALVNMSLAKMNTSFSNFRQSIDTSNGRMKRFGKTAGFAAKGLVGIVGTGNLIAIGVAAAAYGLYKWYQWQKKIAQEQRDQEKALVSQKNLLANSLDIQIKKQRQLNLLTAASAPGAGPSVFDLATELGQTDEGKNLINDVKDASPYEQETIAAAKYAQVLDAVGGNSRKATKYIQALFLAAGDGAWEAERKARDLANTLSNPISDENQKVLWSRLIAQNFDGVEGEAEIQGESLGKALSDGMYRAAQQSGKRVEVFDDFAAGVSMTWDTAFNNIDASAAEFFTEMGITSGQELNAINQDYQKFSQGIMDASEFKAKWDLDPIKQSLELDQIRNNMYMYMGDEVKTIQETEQAIVDVLRRNLGIKREIATLDELRATKEFMAVTFTKQQAAAAWEHEKAILAGAHGTMSIFGANKKNTEQSMLNALNQWRVNQGLKETGNLADGLGRRTKDINGNTIAWGSALARANVKLAQGVNLTERQRKILKAISNEDVSNILKDTMNSYQEGIADNTTAAFDASMDAAISGIEADGERRMDRLDRQQENAMRAFDKRWENRTESVERHYDAQIDAVQKQIDAEEKADDIRQKLFDAEMARIDRLNSMANRNIDFNVALNSGNFDEAAKIRNDAEAEAAGWALEDAAAGESGKKDDRVERLEKKIDRLGDIKDRRLEHLKDIEDAERRSLERSQQRREDAVKADVDATVAAEKKKWEVQKKHLDEALKHFLGYTATSDKDLQKHIKIWEDRYGKFNLVTEGKFDATSENIAAYLKQNLADSRREFANAKDWQLSGAEIANNLLKGAFGMTTQDFKKWLTTGVWPDGANPPTVDDIAKKFAPGGSSAAKKNERMLGPTYHTGGKIGVDPGGRKGYARTAPMHRNEIPIVAERGEYMVNKDAASKHAGILESINSGRFGTDQYGVGGGDPGMGFAGLMGALMAKAVFGSIATGIQSGAMTAIANQTAANAAAGSYSAGKAGKYSDVNFDAEQLKNAAIISSVGKQMGMSARDIQIGIMTAITESMLRNVQYGDRDSLGLFQQRPSMGWGTPAQVTNPEYAARAFFTPLKAHTERAAESPWLAAQHIQRSAYSDGSNYQKYWDEAQAIFKSLSSTKSNTTGTATYASGKGGWRKPSIPGRGWSNTHDYRNPIGSPLYAVSDGTIVESRAITSGGSAGNGLYATPYRSYGETVAMRTASGDIFRYAHMSPGTRIGLGPVKGGTMIGRSGNTGNSSGPHTHFDVNGNYDALGWLRKHGIGLKTGGYTMTDGLANLHKNEVVVSPERTKKLYDGIDRFAEGSNSTYNVNVNVTQPGASADEIVNKTIIALKRIENRKPQSRRA